MAKEHQKRTLFTNRNGKATPTLVMPKGYSLDQAINHWCAKGWNLDTIPYHQVAGTELVHAGVIPDCLKCNPVVSENKNGKAEQVPSKPFIHVPINSEKDISNAWVNVPRGRLPVVFCSYGGVLGIHLTMIYHICSVNKAVALWHLWNKLVKDNETLNMTIDGISDINSHLYPDTRIYSVKTRLKGGWKSILDKLSDYKKWVPHITDHSGKLQVGDKLILHPDFHVIYALDKADDRSVDRYLKSLE